MSSSIYLQNTYLFFVIPFKPRHSFKALLKNPSTSKSCVLVLSAKALGLSMLKCIFAPTFPVFFTYLLATCNPLALVASIYITSTLPLWVFSSNLRECKLSPSKRKLKSPFSSAIIFLSSTSLKTGMLWTSFLSTSSSCSSQTSPYFFLS